MAVSVMPDSRFIHVQEFKGGCINNPYGHGVMFKKAPILYFILNDQFLCFLFFRYIPQVEYDGFDGVIVEHIGHYTIEPKVMSILMPVAKAEVKLPVGRFQYLRHGNFHSYKIVRMKKLSSTKILSFLIGPSCYPFCGRASVK